MNIAHYFTFLRIFIIPLFPIFYLYYRSLNLSFYWLPYILLFILAICEVTDLIDGFLARKRNEVTDLGKILDPMADSITRLSVFFTFTQGVIALPILLILVFLYREFLITTLRTVCAFKGFALAARRSGKIKAVIQACINFFIIILIIPFSWGILSLEALRKISFWIMFVAAIYSVLTALDYIWANRQYIKKVID